VREAARDRRATLLQELCVKCVLTPCQKSPAFYKMGPCSITKEPHILSKEPYILAMLLCIAVCGSVWQCVAVCGSVQQCVAVCGSVWQCVAVCGSVWQCVAVCGSVWQCVAVCGSMLYLLLPRARSPAHVFAFFYPKSPTLYQKSPTLCHKSPTPYQKSTTLSLPTQMILLYYQKRVAFSLSHHLKTCISCAHASTLSSPPHGRTHSS